MIFISTTLLITLTGFDAAKTKEWSPLVPAINMFTMNFLKKQIEIEPNENIFFSPFSIQAVLTLVMGGARDLTERSMRKALGYIYLNVHIRDPVSEEAKLKPEFIEYGKGYHAEISNENFSNPSEVQNKINSWVAKNTRNMIPKLLKNPPSMMSMILAISAIYFKGEWNETFNTSLTEARNFLDADGKTKKVPMMTRPRGSRARFNKQRNFDILEIPYKDSMSMYVLLPHRNETTKKMIAEIRRTKGLGSIFDSLLTRRFDSLSIPKFKITKEYKLNEILIKLGMNSAFSNGADFSGICDKDIKISEVRHEAMIVVNEEGTHAAAATSVNMVQKSRPHLLLNFIVDRPFMFLIGDRSNQIILFAGIINKL
ncbi:iripin-2-like [Brevipalpus obovatus]|uniref:iripin-2-like n=1 Tax=Brevipalpus obovatus TaxID=246614 RepID=UPI003D9F3B48